MKKTTQNKFYNRLAQYGALSLAIAGVADASGQIVYTDVDPDAGGTQFIDLNGDAADDFFINFVASSAVRGAPIGGSSNSLGNAFIGSTTSSFNYPANLTAGAVISASNTSWNSVYAYHDFCYADGYSNSNFCSATDAYIGLRFDIGGVYHYGWARIDVTTAAGVSNYVLKDYAYNTVAGEPINAGQQTLSTEDFGQQDLIHIGCKDRLVTISNVNGDANYRILDITGKQVLNGNTRLETQTIAVDNLTSGIYIVEVSDAKSNAVKRKKILVD